MRLGLLLILISLNASASTWVGNGGNAGDVEWRVTLKQIQMATEQIQKDPPPAAELCTCNDTYKNASMCEALSTLTSEQRNFCGVTLKKQLPQISTLVHDDRTVRVSWTTDNIDVLENGRRRAVDAVTDRTQGTVTLNADQFRSMNPSERVFLISHELQHLTTLDGKPVVDEGTVGPFTGPSGSRALVNAMAAAIVIQTEEAKAFKRYRGTLHRSQGIKENWFELNYGFGSASASSKYSISDYKGGSLRYTHYFGNIGINGEYSSRTGDRSTLSTIKSHEEVTVTRVGASFRVFPFKDPLTILGQSHLVFSADVDFVRGTFNLKDTVNDETSTMTRTGASGAIRYQFPIYFGFWLTVAEAYESLPGSYMVSGIQIDNDKNIFVTSIGASYAF